MTKVSAEYIWIDGSSPTKELRSKTKILSISDSDRSIGFPRWGFDGSSTQQAEGSNSDCILVPVRYFKDPFRCDGYLVLCEVCDPDGETPHVSNTRAELRSTLAKGATDVGPLFGLEQEYVIMKGQRILGWPPEGFPPPQGREYCGVGGDRVSGRAITEEHMDACLRAGIIYEGKNFEVMLGQAEFQVGAGDPLMTADHLWVARWILSRVAEDHGCWINLHPKPILDGGGFNGSGCHTNFSTAEMRAEGGLDAIYWACEKLQEKHAEHIAVYGADNHLRLTGKHETCGINTFKYGVADRGCSIRIPRHVNTQRYGFLEDRRPASNMDPYQVCNIILKTTCGIE